MNTLIPRMKFNEVVDGVFNKSLSDIIGTDFSFTQPALTIIEEEDHFSVELAAPGMDKADFNIEMNNGILSISAEQRSEKEEEEPGTYKRREYNYSDFKRSLRIAESVDTENISASYDKGILLIELAKKNKAEVETKKFIDIK